MINQTQVFWPKLDGDALNKTTHNNFLELKMDECIGNEKLHGEKVLPNNNVNYLSYMSLNWMTKLIWKASRHGLVKEDIAKIGEKEAVDINHKRFLHEWEKDLKIHGYEGLSLVRVIWNFNRNRFLVAGLLVCIFYIGLFSATSWITKNLLEFLGDPNLPWWHGAVLALAMSVALMVKNITFNLFWIVSSITGIRTQGALQLLIYTKILRLKNGGETIEAELLNYYAGDIDRIFQIILFAGYAIGVPIVTILNITYGYILIGPWALLGNGIIFIYYPLLIFITNKVIKLRIESAGYRDKRINMLNQILSNIKSIKMYSWEEAFYKVAKVLRENEASAQLRAFSLESCCYISTICFPCIAPTASVIGYALMGGKLSTSLLFTFMSMSATYMVVLHSSLHMIKAATDGFVSCERIRSVLLSTEKDPKDNGNIVMNTNDAIVISEVAMTWSDIFAGQTRQTNVEKNKSSSNKKEVTNNAVNNLNANVKITLNRIQVSIEKGKLIGICGSVGSGKSSLLSVITNWGTLLKGHVYTNGSIGIVTQKAWIISGTILQNVIFGLPYEETRYQKAIWGSCLEKDLALMPEGNLTEIGERGSNLSGGQRVRLTLARALYANRDIYLLDDVFSAVDVNVAKSLFSRCIKTCLQDKTVLLATHSADLLQQCDSIIVMKDGEIAHQGKYCQLKSIENDSYIQAILGENVQKQRQGETATIDSNSFTNAGDKFNEPVQVDKMVKDEIDSNSSLTWKTWLYFCKMCGGYSICIFTFFTEIIFNLAMLFHGFWIQIWINEKTQISTALYSCEIGITEVNTYSNTMRLNMLIWMLPPIIMILSGLLRSILTPQLMIKGATAMHHTMFWKIIRCPVSFFITTPLGRIIHRFSKDMDELDVHIPFTGEYVVQNLLLICLQIITVGYLLPYYFIAFCLFLGLIVVTDLIFNGSVREFKRIANLFHPNILIHVSNTVQGLPIIRCYDMEHMFIEKFKQIIDANLSANLLFHLSSKWLAFRIELQCWATVTVMAALIVYSKGTLTPTNAGLAMLQITWIALTLATTMRWKAELTSRVISIERIAEYCLDLPQELPAIIHDNRSPPEWPNKGSVDFNEVSLRYHSQMPFALHGITAHINAGEKVGIIGRTGAGKSSTIEAILRLTEICQGSIVIDGIDISKIGLTDLRSNIAVVPQDPILFNGSIRWNLDPFDKCSDEELWNCLAKVHLKSKIYDEPSKLETLLNNKIDLFSSGEKQLFCLARALLKKSRILILDEAMASVDSKTDLIIQNLLRESFSHCTILAVAHRLNTVADYDKIITMDEGKIIEFDTPNNLLANNESVFRNMMMKFNNEL